MIVKMLFFFVSATSFSAFASAPLFFPIEKRTRKCTAEYAIRMHWNLFAEEK